MMVGPSSLSPMGAEPLPKKARGGCPLGTRVEPPIAYVTPVLLFTFLNSKSDLWVVGVVHRQLLSSVDRLRVQ
jgi:hypothetical protein